MLNLGHEQLSELITAEIIVKKDTSIGNWLIIFLYYQVLENRPKKCFDWNYYILGRIMLAALEMLADKLVGIIKDSNKKNWLKWVMI